MKKLNFIKSINVLYAFVIVCGIGLVSCEDDEIGPLADDEIISLASEEDSTAINSADSAIQGNNAAPTSLFSVQDWGTVGEEIEFTDLSSDEDGEIVSWEWNFGDTNTSTESNPLHIYSEAGDYTVLLAVTDNSGLIDTLSAKISITSAFEADSESTGTNPQGNLIESNGKLWGMTQSGGIDNQGVIFTINPDGSGYQEVFRFNGINGSTPYGSLLESDGKLWGMTTKGGTYDQGVIFSIDTDGTGYRKVYNFEGKDGSKPVGNLIVSNGKFWGMTSEGGASRGVIFTMNLDGTNFKKVHDFVFETGYMPHGSLVEAYGKLWGTTRNGGEFDYGTVFSINTDGTGYTNHYHSKGLVGGYPEGNLVAHDNRLWGLAYDMIFSLSNTGDEFKAEYKGVLKSRGSLIFHEGKFWGMTQAGGIHSDGDVFSFSPGGKLEVIHEFNESIDQSNHPYGDLLVVDNKIWGMLCGSSWDGWYYAGAIFSIEANGSNYELEHSF